MLKKYEPLGARYAAPEALTQQANGWGGRFHFI
jgi:hypothetical protein